MCEIISPFFSDFSDPKVLKHMLCKEEILKVISSEFPCDGKREFSMGCECGKRNVTDEIEKHCQASARIEGGGKGSLFSHLGLTPSLTERQKCM